VTLEATKGVQTINEIASANNLHPNQLSSWKKRLLAEGPSAFSRVNGSQAQAQAEQAAAL
jgi:transposase-like protein